MKISNTLELELLPNGIARLHRCRVIMAAGRPYMRLLCGRGRGFDD
jgi:hypothetical protein